MSMFAFLVVLLGAVGCVTSPPLVYNPSRDAGDKDLPTPSEAKTKITETLARIVKPTENGGRVTFEADKMIVRIVDKDSPNRVFEVCEFSFATGVVPGIHDWGDGIMSKMRYQVDLLPGKDLCLLLWGSSEDAYAFVDSLLSLKRAGGGLSRLKDERREFTKLAARYRANPGRFELEENAIRYKVQAEDAFSKKKFEKAILLFEKALEIAPWWPSGRYNRALLLGELDRPAEAIEEMKRYLVLEPDAKDSRKAQNKIYIWEGEMSAK